MNLNATWIGPVGPNINYTVQYRPYPSEEVFTTFSTTVHNNYAVIPSLPDGFYEVNVSMLCGEEFSPVASMVGGKPTCDIPTYVSFQTIEDATTYQKIRITLSNNSTTLRVRIKRANVIFKDEEVGATSFYETELPKSTQNPQTYDIEIANVCNGGMSNFVNMGSYTVQQMSPGFEVLYSSDCECSGIPTIIFTDTSANTYTNPEFLPLGVYNVSVSIPTTCVENGILTYTAISGVDTVFSIPQEVEKISDLYVFSLDGIETSHGVALGSHVEILNLKLSC